MWIADIFCDLDWVFERKGILGEKRFSLRGAKSGSLGIQIEFHFFGDEQQVRHVRVLMHTDDQKTAETCVDLNIQTWVAALEATVMMETRKPFRVALRPGTEIFLVVMAHADADSPAVLIQPQYREAPKLAYERIAYGFAAWNAEVRHHLFYFRRFIDNSLPLDVRWLNGYRLLEWHFRGNHAGLAKCEEWRTFVARFEDILKPLRRSQQTGFGLLEEARALAAHAGLDDRTDAERARDPRNAMEKTFAVLESMVMTALNEHPNNVKSPIKFVPASSTASNANEVQPVGSGS